MGHKKSPLACKQRVDVDRIVVCSNHNPHLENMEVWNCEDIAPFAAKEKYLLDPNSYEKKNNMAMA